MSGAHWTEERTAKFCRLHAQGLSPKQLADVFDITRNAVIGKIHRMKLETRRQTTPQKPYMRKVKRLINHGNRFDHVEINAPSILPPMPDGSSTPAAQRCTLLQLKPGVCKWPFGEPASPDFFFCGGDAIEGKPYCAGHCRVAYRGYWN